MNKESLKEYLSSRYQGWSSFLNNVIFPIFGEDDFEDGFETELLESQPERRQLAEATGIRSIKQVGMMYVGVEPLQIFDVTVSDRVMMEHNRVNIQRLIRAVMDQFSCAFMLFHYEDDTRWDWRFTYCRKSGNKEESTDSKRYTFLLGPGQSCRTATDNFIALYDKRDCAVHVPRKLDSISANRHEGRRQGVYTSVCDNSRCIPAGRIKGIH